MSPAYRALLKEYSRILRQRNALLKTEAAQREQHEALEDQLVAAGAKLAVHRAALAGRICVRSQEAYAALSSGEGLAMNYAGTEGIASEEWERRPAVSEVEDRMRREIACRRAEERVRKTTLVGPHRDDVQVAIGGRSARSFASQGQQRSAALAWKLAEVGVVEDVLGKRPILLLDDVMSELDEERRDALASLVHRDVQTVVTTANLGYFSSALLAKATVVELGR